MARWAYALALVLCAGPALADDAADVGAARELGIAGVKLADAGNCTEAIDKLARAEKLHHAPTILGRLGECQVEVGKLVEGTENLQKVVREPLAPNAPKAFVVAVERAQKVLAVAQPKIARLTIVVEPSSANPTVTIDGVALSSAAIGTPRPMDPGTHEITMSAPGFVSSTAKVVLAESEAKRFEWKLAPVPAVVEPKPVEPPKEVEPPPPPPTRPAAPPPAPEKPKPVDDSYGEGRTVAWVALGVGAVGLVSGATFGFVALDARKTLDEDCPDKKCPQDSEKTLDAANRWATLSTVGFIFAGVGTGIGAFLFATVPSRTSASITPVIGLGNVGLQGTF